MKKKKIIRFDDLVPVQNVRGGAKKVIFGTLHPEKRRKRK